MSIDQYEENMGKIKNILEETVGKQSIRTDKPQTTKSEEISKAKDLFRITMT